MAPPKLPNELSRRTLLKTGLVGAGLVLVGSAALALQKPRSREGHAYKVLTAAEAGVLSALANRLCPALGAGAPGAQGVSLVEMVDHALSRMDEESQKGVKLGLILFDNGLTRAIFGQGVRPFSQLSADEQDASMRAWRASSVGFRRTLYRGLSSFVMTVYWGDPRSWGRSGYSGPPDARGLRAAYADNLVDFSDLRAPSESKGV